MSVPERVLHARGLVDSNGELTAKGEDVAERRHRGDAHDDPADLPVHVYEHLLPWDVPNDGGPVR